MKIQNLPLQKFNTVQNTNPKQKSAPLSFASISKGNVPNWVLGITASEISFQKIEEEKHFEEFLSAGGKLSKKDVERIKKKYPSYIILAEKKLKKEAPSLKTLPKDAALVGLAAKKYLDNEYGKNNYRVISIGTSPAPITEVMAAAGADIVFLPISSLSNYINPHKGNDNNLDISGYPNIQKALEYLKRKGVNENSKKINIITDFCSTGKSLLLAHDLVLQYNNVPKENFKKREIETLINAGRFYEEDVEGDSLITSRAVMSIRADMVSQKFEYISNVPHFYINDNENLFVTCSISSKDKTDEELFYEFDNYSKPLARAFSLCAINEVLKIENKKNPEQNPD